MAVPKTYFAILNKDVDFTDISVDGTLITATPAELNTLASSGLSAADMVKVAALTASAAEINTLASSGLSAADMVKLAALTATAAELNLSDNQVADATFVVGSESSDTITVNIQLVDGAAADMATRSAVQFYLSSDANGDSVATAATSLVAGTDGVMIESVSNSAGMLISEADGDIDVVVGDTGSTTYYLVLVMPKGNLVVSGAITLA